MLLQFDDPRLSLLFEVLPYDNAIVPVLLQMMMMMMVVHMCLWHLSAPCVKSIVLQVVGGGSFSVLLALENQNTLSLLLEEKNREHYAMLPNSYYTKLSTTPQECRSELPPQIYDLMTEMNANEECRRGKMIVSPSPKPPKS